MLLTLPKVKVKFPETFGSVAFFNLKAVCAVWKLKYIFSYEKDALDNVSYFNC